MTFCRLLCQFCYLPEREVLSENISASSIHPSIHPSIHSSPNPWRTHSFLWGLFDYSSLRRTEWRSRGKDVREIGWKLKRRTERKTDRKDNETEESRGGEKTEKEAEKRRTIKSTAPEKQGWTVKKSIHLRSVLYLSIHFLGNLTFDFYSTTF